LQLAQSRREATQAIRILDAATGQPVPARVPPGTYTLAISKGFELPA
jgi:hypothetical protein